MRALFVAALICVAMTLVASADILEKPMAAPVTGGIRAISLVTGPCEGICPVYSLKIVYGDIARFEGTLADGRSGSFTALVDFDRIAQWLATQDLPTSNRSYNTNVVDAATSRFEIVRDRRLLVLDNRNTDDAPPLLFGLGAVLADVIRQGEWRDGPESKFLGYYVAASGVRAGVALYPNGNGLAVEAFENTHGLEVWDGPPTFSSGSTASVVSGGRTIVLRVAQDDMDVTLHAVPYRMHHVDRRTFRRLRNGSSE